MMKDAKSILVLQLFLILCSLLLLPSDQEEESFVPESPLILDPELNEQLFKSEINNLVLNIFRDNRKLLEGIDNIYLTQHPIDFLIDNGSHACTATHALGAHSHSTIIIVDAGYEANKHTLYHEIGHHLWDALSTEEKAAWTALFRQTETFLNEYAKTNPNENFAENLACYYTNYRSCTTKMMAEKVRFIEAVVN